MQLSCSNSIELQPQLYFWTEICVTQMSSAITI